MKFSKKKSEKIKINKNKIKKNPSPTKQKNNKKLLNFFWIDSRISSRSMDTHRSWVDPRKGCGRGRNFRITEISKNKNKVRSCTSTYEVTNKNRNYIEITLL